LTTIPIQVTSGQSRSLTGRHPVTPADWSGCGARGWFCMLLPGGLGIMSPGIMTGVGGASLDWDRRRRVTPVQTASHMWTAPGLQDLAQRTDRSDCDHMSGLLSRSHMTAAKMGSATRVPNRKATFEEGHWDSRSVSRLGIESITPSAPSRASFGLNSRAPVRLP